MQVLREAQQREAQEAEERRLKLKQEQKKHREKIAREKAEKILTDIENKINRNDWKYGSIFLLFIMLGGVLIVEAFASFPKYVGTGYWFLSFLVTASVYALCSTALFYIYIRNKQVRLINDYINAHPNSPETIYMIGVRNTLMDCIFTSLGDLISRLRVKE